MTLLFLAALGGRRGPAMYRTPHHLVAAPTAFPRADAELDAFARADATLVARPRVRATITINGVVQ